MRTTIEYKESTKYDLQLKGVAVRTDDISSENSLIHSSFYNFASNDGAVFGGFSKEKHSKFIESLFNIALVK